MTNSKKLYALNALWEKPDDIIKVAEKVSGEGYTDFDTHTPYPLHGMDDAMKLKPSQIGVFALVFGICGGIAALLMMYGTAVFDYPLTYAGKPHGQLPAFIPITFELTILFTGHLTVFSLLFFFCRLPRANNPVIHSPYMEAVSCDHFGMMIKASDPKFNAETIEAMYKDLNAVKIVPIFDTQQEGRWIIPYINYEFTAKHLAGITLGKFVGAAVVTYIMIGILPRMIPFTWMESQDRGNAQSVSEFYKNGKKGMQLPPKNTIARGYLPYEFAESTDTEEIDNMVNPIIVSDRALQRGKVNYNIYCAVCHGSFGKGDGRLKDYQLIAPSLHSSKLRDGSDGLMYHVITVGQNSMAAQAGEIPRNDRWGIVHYIRALQRASAATDADVTFAKETI